MKFLQDPVGESPVSKTLIAVPIERLHAEYISGVRHQQADEHWRKKVRLSLSLGSTLVALLLSGNGIGTISIPYFTLLFNCFLHVVL